jgi:hypothetical protein
MQDPMNQPPCEPDRQDAQPSTSAKDQSEGRLNQVKEQITSFGRSAVDRVEAQREPAAQAPGGRGNFRFSGWPLPSWTRLSRVGGHTMSIVRSIPELLHDIVANFQHLIRSELQLAKTEMREEAAKA